MSAASKHDDSSDWSAAIGACKTRAMAAAVYAAAIRSDERGMVAVDWPALNRAIVDRWSVAGLTWIKSEAWKLA